MNVCPIHGDLCVGACLDIIGEQMDFYEAWRWLSGHPINMRSNGSGSLLPPYNVGMYDLDIAVARVNSITHTIEDDATLNDTTEIWLEFGPYHNITEGYLDLGEHFERSHDPNLDVGGNTFEEAIINLAAKVLEYYGDY